MATEDRTTDNGRGEHRQDTNVVPFPGDWIGPRDELVPVASDSVRERDAGPPFEPDAFWSENSDAIHDVLKAPAPQPELPARSRRPRVRRPAVRLRPVAVFGSAVALTAVAVALVPALVASLAGQSRPHPSAVARTGSRQVAGATRAAGLVALSRLPRPGAGLVARHRPRLAGARGRAHRAHGRRSRAVASGIFVSDRGAASSGGGGQTGSSWSAPAASGGSQGAGGGSRGTEGGGSVHAARSGPSGPGSFFGPGHLG